MRYHFSFVKGFTLVELLVVIVVVGILAVLFLAELSRGIQTARKTDCANNLRQLGHALELFVDDNRAYPLESNPDYDKGGYPNHFDFWDLALDHELAYENNSHQADYKSKGIWKCPAAAEPPDWPENYFNKGTTRIVYVSYGYDARGTCPTGGTNWLGLGGEYARATSKPSVRPTRESEVVSPSEMMAIGDGFIGHDDLLLGGESRIWRTGEVIPHVKSDGRDTARHQGTINVVYCDGHVESPALKFLFTSTNGAALAHWNRDDQAHRENL